MKIRNSAYPPQKELFAVAAIIVCLSIPATSWSETLRQQKLPTTQTRTLPQPVQPVNQPGAQKVDPTSLQLTVGLNFLPPIDNTKISTPAPVKQGTVVPLSCAWKAAFIKPANIPSPINLTIVIAESTNGIVQLKQAAGFIKQGNYSFPGSAGQGTVDVMWKPDGLGIHEVGCMVTTTNAAWWGQGSLPMVKQTRKVQVEPDKFKLCPTWYPVQVGKSPKSDQSGAVGTVAPAEVILNFDYSQAMGNQFVCHYRSKSGDIPDVSLTVPCLGAKLLPPQGNQMLKSDRYYCNE